MIQEEKRSVLTVCNPQSYVLILLGEFELLRSEIASALAQGNVIWDGK